MRLIFVVNHIYIDNGWSPWSKRVGGSEECVIEWSQRLAKDHEVTVYHNGRNGVYKNVEYKNHSDFRPGDVTININFPQWPVRGKTIYWSSLTDNPDLSDFDAVCVLSKYAMKHTNVNHDNVYIVPPGYDPEEVYPDKKIPKQCFYASSPDRGLDTLLEAWPAALQAHPDATLLITYGAPQTDLPGVINLGSVDKKTMNDIYRTSDIWCHPATSGELYCITGVKAQAAGCIPVVIPTMALAETVRHGYKTDQEHYAETLTRALGADNTQLRGSLRREHYPTWTDSTNKLLEIIKVLY